MVHTIPPKAQRSSEAPDLPKSMAVALKKVRADFTDFAAWETLDEICRQFDRPDQAVALYTEALASPLQSDDLAEVGRLAADFCEEWYEETEPVLEMLTSVLAADPKQFWAFERLTILLTVSADWDSLLEAYDVALAVAEDIDRKELLLTEAAKVARDFASLPERGSDYLKELLLLRLEDDLLASTLEKRFDEQERHMDLIEIWTARLPVLNRDVAQKTRLQIATRYLDQLTDAESSLLSVDEYLEAAGDPEPAFPVLERLADGDSASSEVKRQALQLLERLYSRAGKWAEVISVLQRALFLAETNDERIVFHRRAAELLRKVEDYEAALGQCAEILRLRASADDVRVQARNTAEKINRLDIYVDAIVTAARASDVDERRVELLIEAAQVRNDHLRDMSGAIELYFCVEKDDAADESARLLACRELSVLLENADRDEELLTILEKRADLERKLTERSRIVGQAASLATRLEQGDRALRLWSMRLDDDQTDEEALSAKIDLLEKLGKFQGLVDALVQRANLDRQPGAQREDLVRAATIQAEHLVELESAIALWREIETRFGRVPESLDELVALSARAGLHEHVVRLLTEGIEVEVVPSRMVVQLTLLGDTQRVHLGEASLALESYKKALALDPRYMTAREGLRELLGEGTLTHLVAEALADALRRSEDFIQIVGLVEVRLEAAPDDNFRARILLDAAEIEEQADNQAGAMQALSRAFALAPGDKTETELHRMAEATGDWQSATDSYSRAIAGLSDESKIGELYLARGRVEEDQLGRPDAATVSYREASRRAPQEAAIIHSLVRAAHHARLFDDAAWGVVENSRALGHVSAYQFEHFAARADEHGDWRGTLAGLQKSIASAEDLGAQVAHDLKEQLALWYRDRANDSDAAEKVLLDAVAEFSQESSLRLLAELQRRAPGRPLVVTLTALAEVCGDELTVLREAGDVALEKAFDTTLAEPILERAFQVAAERFIDAGGTQSGRGLEASDIVRWAVDQLVKVATADHRASEAVELLKRSARLPFDANEQVARLYRAAEVAADADLSEQSVSLCEAILLEEGKHEGAITLLSALHEKAGRLDQLLELRQRELSLQRPLERRLFLRLDQARVLGQLDAAKTKSIEILEENLQDSPGHEQSVEALARILGQEESYEALVSLLETQAKAVLPNEPTRAASLFQRAGQLADEELGDEVRLAKNYKQSVAASATIFVLDRLAAISEKHQDWESEVSWLQLRLSLTPDASESQQAPQERRNVVGRLATALVQSDDSNGARQVLEAELIVDPAADNLRKPLIEIYENLQEWFELCRLFAEGVEYVETEQERISYLRSAALVSRRRLGDLDSAIPLLERAISLDNTDKALRLLLADTFRCAQKYQEAKELLEALLEEFGRRRTKDRAVVHTQLARIAQAEGDLDEALLQAESAAKIERTDPVILMLVGQLARQKGQLGRAEQAYRTLALIASRRPTKALDDDAEQIGESAILFELYRIAEERGDDAQARELLDSALAVATRDRAEAVHLGESLLESGRITLLLEALEQRLNSDLSPDATAQILVTKADVLLLSQQVEASFDARLQALSQTPEDLSLLESTKKAAEQCGESPKFWAHLTEIAENPRTSKEVAGDLWYRLGLAAETEERDVVLAADMFERAQLTGQHPKRVFLALDRVLDEGADPRRVQTSLLRFVSSKGAEATPLALSDALYRLADFELLEGAPSEACAHLKRALDVGPQEDRVLSMLEGIVRDGEASSEIRELFLRVCRKAAIPETLLYAFRMVAVQDEVEIPLLVEAVVLARSLNDGAALREMLSRIIQLADSEQEGELLADVFVERATLARKDEEYELESELLKLAIPLFAAPEKFELELRLANCVTQHLGKNSEGQALFESLLSRAPDDRRVWRPLLNLYRDAGETNAVEELISEVETRVETDADLETLKMERVRLMVGADRLAEAEAELRSTLEERPHMAEAATILADLLRKAERWDELIDLLHSLYEQARQRKDVEMVVRFGTELAQLLVNNDREAAITLLTEGLSVAENERGFVEHLLSLYTDEDNQSERSDIMEKLLRLLPEEQVQELAFALYSLRVELGDEYGAGKALDIAVGLAPRREELLQLYVDFLRSREEYPRLAEMLELKASQTGRNAAGAELFADAARIYDEELGDAKKASEVISKAYEYDSSNATYLERSAQYLVSIGQIEEALEQLKIAIDLGDEMSLADLLELRAEIILRESPHDREAMVLAASDLSRALEQLIPEEQEVSLQRSRLRALLELRVLHQAANDSEQERQTVLELARIQVEMGDDGDGIDTLATWLTEHETDVEVAQQMGIMATKAGVHEAAIFAYDRLVRATEGEGKIDALLLLADAAQAAGDPMNARSALEDAFSQEPTNLRLRNRLRAIYEAAGAHQELAQILVSEVEKTEDAEEKASLFIEAGELYLQAEQAEEACRQFEEALKLTSSPYGVTSKLAAGYLSLGEVDSAEKVLNEAVKVHGKRRSPELAVLQSGLARVAQAKGNDDGMFAWLEAALMSDRTNGDVAKELAVRGQEQGRYDIAIKALQSLTLSKVAGPMSKAEAYFRQAQIAQVQGDEKKALLMARRAHSTDASLDGLAELLNQVGG